MRNTLRWSRTLRSSPRSFSPPSSKGNQSSLIPYIAVVYSRVGDPHRFSADPAKPTNHLQYPPPPYIAVVYAGVADPHRFNADPDSSYTFKMPTKNNLKNFFCLLLFENTLTSFFKDKKSKRRHKAAGIKVFHTNFA
jgi:hypothetical protein